MYHVAFLYPNRHALATVLKRLIDADYMLEGAADHGVSEAIYLRDPDNNGVEVYTDRPKDTWTVSNDGLVEMVTEPLDLAGLLAELTTPIQ
jgi:catechol 2,3-dioxygenase